MDTLELIQGSDEWKAARCGSLGASRIADMMVRTKSGWGASRANLASQLVVERLTRIPTEGFVSEAMRWGQENEADARVAYEFRTNLAVEEVGIVPHPTIEKSHASPDGLVGTDGLVEIKCPNTATHIDTLLNPAPDGKYVLQMQWQMACTGRQWCDFASFDPRLPEAMRLVVTRINRNPEAIENIEKEVRAFLAEIDATVAALRNRYLREAA